MALAILLILAYLMGSVPTAVWVSKWVFGIDIREHGSGNAGATNTFRILGTKAGCVVMLVDMMKGFLAVKLAFFSPLTVNSEPFVNLQIFLGLFAVLGHIFPVWADFRGGKGIATLFGMILSIQYGVALSLVLVFLLMLMITRYVSLSSIVASIAFPVLLISIFSAHAQELSYRLFAIATAFLVVFTHHKNISRLFAGNESKVPLFRKKSHKS
jgi:glycerol-3-phosphate acyltransferase PlsY